MMPNRSVPRRAPLALALLTALVWSACSSEAPPPDPPTNPLAVQSTAPSEISVPEPTTGDLTFMAQDSQLILVGELKRLDLAPGRIGDPCAWQGATYRVVEVLRGSAPDGELRVAHPVCLGHPLVDNRTVGLSPTHYTPGAKFILFLRPEARRPSNSADGAWVADYVVWNERTGSLPVSDALREEVAKAVAAAGGPGTRNDPFRGRRRR